MTEVKTRKKLIEVALPLDAINAASVRENFIYRGNPSALHKWWAQRPLAVARAVLFAQMVDDPSSHPERLPTTEEQDAERKRLFEIIEELVLWENTTNEEVLEKARTEIRRSWRWTCEDNKDHPQAAELFDPDKLPAFYDPFAGGGSLPLEAQRLGLEAHASDLNPVAVVINKAVIDIPARFAGRRPVNPESRKQKDLLKRPWRGAEGLAEDVRYYGKWMRDEAEKRIGHLYPKVKVTDEMVAERPDLEQYRGRELTVIAWIWARTVRSPNPAFADVDVPLVSTFMLSTKQGKEAWVQPIVEGGAYRFEVRVGPPADLEATKTGTKLGRGANFRCLMSGVPMEPSHIYHEAEAGRMGSRLMAVVADGDRGRVYLRPAPDHEAAARQAAPEWMPDVAMPENPRWFSPPLYGLKTFGDLFTPRQLVALTTFSDLVAEAIERIREDAIAAGIPDDGTSLHDGGTGATAYAEAVGVYLTFACDKVAEYSCTIVPWYAKEDRPKGLFARQAIPMVWDYAEVNVLGSIGGTFFGSLRVVSGALSGCSPQSQRASAEQCDAVAATCARDRVVSTDPPYYDNVGYADLSDFFYVWLRRSLRAVFPDLFATLVVPKAEELVATAYRHGGKERAEAFFMDGMTRAMKRVAEQAHAGFPVTIYYAFKQTETDGRNGAASTGWETFLGAVICAGLGISGTWPIRTERSARSIGLGTNALASSIVLVCRRRSETAPVASRRDFLSALKAELPTALAHLQQCSIAPVDLAQAAIGPGMATYTRYSRVLESDGTPLDVRAALALINQVLDESLAEQEGDFDSDTRWALAWFEEDRFSQGDYGRAEVLATAKNTSVRGIEEAGILVSRAGQVRLLKPSELPEDWDPASDGRLTTWECVHHLIRVLESEGEAAAAALVARLGPHADVARELAYRLYTICERKKWANEAKAYNGLVVSWSAIESLVGSTETSTAAAPQQKELPGM